MLPPADSEPAPRDPKKLARTAWILVGVMLVGGWLVLKAYEKWALQKAGDDRPAIIHQIRKERDLRMLRQDGKIVDLFELRGKVVVVNALSLKNPAPAGRSMAVMRRLSETMAKQPDFALVSLLVDPVPPEELAAVLSQVAGAHGMALPQWWLGGSEAETMHKFIKNELKAGVFPHQDGSALQYDPSLVLLDRNGHLRRAVIPTKSADGKFHHPQIIPFDFDQAAKWDADGRKSGSDLSNEAQMEALLLKTIHTLLAEPAGQ